MINLFQIHSYINYLTKNTAYDRIRTGIILSALFRQLLSKKNQPTDKPDLTEKENLWSIHKCIGIDKY